MKVKGINNSSRKTRKLIRSTFAEMLSEKGTIDKITVTELVNRADINRGTFYTHYDDVYAVAEDFETEILEQFDSASGDIADLDSFIEKFFSFIKENEPYYKMLCRSNELIFSANKLIVTASNRMRELSKITFGDGDPDVEITINVFVAGLTYEYIRYCRGLSDANADKLYDYTKMWCKSFIAYEQSISNVNA